MVAELSMGSMGLPSRKNSVPGPSTQGRRAMRSWRKSSVVSFKSSKERRFVEKCRSMGRLNEKRK